MTRSLLGVVVLGAVVVVAGCQAGVDLGPSCVYDSECSGGLVCRASYCRSRCAGDSDCSSDEVCIAGGCVSVAENVDGGAEDASAERDAGLDGSMPDADLSDAGFPDAALSDAGGPDAGCPDCAISVSAGHTHTCAVRSDGAVLCWGDNAEGELGDGTRLARATPAEVVDLPPALEVVTGHRHSCARTVAGDVYCWGLSQVPGHPTSFMMGDGTATVRRTRPVRVSLPAGAARILAGGYWFTCAGLSDRVMCWGVNELGELGTGSTGPVAGNVPARTGSLGMPSALAAGDGPACAVLAGTLWCWGNDAFSGTGTQDFGPTGVTSPALVRFAGAATTPIDVTAVALGGTPDPPSSEHGAHACAVRASGQLACWGRNDHGQLGIGTVDRARASALVVISSGVRAVSAGGFHTCAIDTSDAARCWGEDASGQLGEAPAGGRDTPGAAVPGLGAVSAISCGGAHTCAIGIDGLVHCFGSDIHGQIGDGTAGGIQTTPVVIDLTP